MRLNFSERRLPFIPDLSAATIPLNAFFLDFSTVHRVWLKSGYHSVGYCRLIKAIEARASAAILGIEQMVSVWGLSLCCIIRGGLQYLVP